MPLANVVKLIPTMTVTTPDGTNIFHFACHQATRYWLYEAANGTPPPLGNYFSDTDSMLCIGPTMSALAKRGTVLRSAGDLSRQPSGTVLIFMGLAGDAKHLCVLDINGNIAGYIQIGWFWGGLSHTYTTHPKSAVKWQGGKQGGVILSDGKSGELRAVDENTAIQFATEKF